MAPDGQWIADSNGEDGQAALLLLGVLGALLIGVLILFGFGQALGAKRRQAADLAAVSGAQAMRRNYRRCSSRPSSRAASPNPRHLSNAAYLALARAAALRGARRNGVSPRQVRVGLPGAGFAPTRIEVSVEGRAESRVAPGQRRERVEVRARAAAEIMPDGGATRACPRTAAVAATTAPRLSTRKAERVIRAHRRW